MPMARNWNGMTLEHKVQRATARAIVAIGVNVAVDTKRLTHRISGTLVRSIHAAPAEEEHDEERELREAQGGTDLLFGSGMIHPHETPFGPAIEVGSWLPYACVEWIGRNHPGITQGLEMNRGMKSHAIVSEAFREEGLL